MFITTPVTVQFQSPAIGTVLTILYPLMFSAIAERPAVRCWALKGTGSGGTVTWWGTVCTVLANSCVTQTLYDAGLPFKLIDRRFALTRCHFAF